MREFKYVITDPQGIHARPAGELVKEAKKYTSSIQMAKDGKTADCRKIFAVMSLAVKAGNEVTMMFDGEDEAAACQAVEAFMKERL